MFFRGYPASAFSPSAFTSLDPTFRERYIRARGTRVKPARFLNQILIRATEHNKDTLTPRLQGLYTATPSTDASASRITFSSNESRAIVGEIIAPTERNPLPSITTGAIDGHLIYPRHDCRYATLEELEKEVKSQWRTQALSKESLEPITGPAQPALSLVQPLSFPIEDGVDIPIDTPTATSTNPFPPLNEDSEFVSIDLNTPSIPAVLVHGTDVNSEDIDDFIVIAREGDYTFFEQSNVVDDASDWIEVDA